MIKLTDSEKLERKQMKVFEKYFVNYKLDFKSNIEDGAKYYMDEKTALVFMAYQVGVNRMRGIINAIT